MPGERAIQRNKRRILVVDDIHENVEILQARLEAQGYEVVTAYDGEEALRKVSETSPDLVLLDVMMPKMDGFQVCRAIKSSPQTEMLPVIMVTARTDTSDIVKGFEVGADDYLTKPYNQQELQARVRSMLRIRDAHLQLEEFNRSLEERVRQQVKEIERMGRLRRYFSPQLAQRLLDDTRKDIMQSHRREITVVFLDLRGFTSFSDSAEPEEIMEVLREFHRTVGPIIFQYHGTLERFAGDGIMVFLGDPDPMDEHPKQAGRMALELQHAMESISRRWEKMGYHLRLGVGMATGYATLGGIGFEGRMDYAAIGTVTNLAARLCKRAAGGQILAPQKTVARFDDQLKVRYIEDMEIEGLSRSVPVYEVLGLNNDDNG
ncbi:MAG: response regulator [Deltaproteobacteria bacterium]|nr:response regulator [Deltaproteobacteria bacterium]